MLLFSCLLTDSQAPIFNLDKFTTANGISDNNVGQVMEDSRGFLWLATSNGLDRYDGKLFKQYNSFGKGGLTDLSINCIAEDRHGNIWIGTSNGLNKLDPFKETITHYYEGNGAGTIPFRWCNYLFVDRFKNLWLTTQKGIALFDEQSNSFTNYPVSVYGGDPRNNRFIDHIIEDHRGRMWLATSYGVKLYDRNSKTFESFHRPETEGKFDAQNIIISLYEDWNGNIWAGTWGAGLLRFNEEKKAFENYQIGDVDRSSLVVTGITKIRIGNADHLLLAVNGGLYYLDSSDSKQRLVKLMEESNVSFGSNPFVKLLNDGRGTIWVGGSTGLFKINLTGQPIKWVGLGDEHASDKYVWHIIPDIQRPHEIFYLTTIDGWWKYETASQTISKLLLPKDKSKLLCYINNWQPDEKGYWFSSVEGFGYYDIYNNRVTDLTSVIKENFGQASTGFIAKDPLGKIWLTVRRNGLLVYDPMTKTTQKLLADSSAENNVLGMSASDMVSGKDGKIYFTVYDRLYRIDPSDLTYKIVKAPLTDEQIDLSKTGPEKIAFNSDNRIFINSKLRVYELKGDSLVTVFPKTGFSSFTIEDIIAGESNSIWLVTSKGVIRTNSDFMKWAIVTPEGGNVKVDFSKMTVYQDALLFNGTGGIGIAANSLLPDQPIPPAVIINKIKYGPKEAYLVSFKPFDFSCSYKEAIQFELSAIDFVNENENKIVYKLDGWDKEWRELNGTPIVRYEQLPPGDYVFKSKTLNTQGNESKETAISFEVKPPFYRSWPFIILCIVSIACILYAVYRYRVRKLLEMERLRTRIATDLHDDIGATLSSISMYSQAIKQQVNEKDPQLEKVLDKMGENSRDMVTSMNDIVWAINPANDQGEKLVQRMESYATDICAVKNIELQFNIDEKLKNISLPVEHRKNVFLIFKEAVNNAVKYSGAKKITVNLLVKGRDIQLVVNDDGKGFDKAMVISGNGLKNFEARAKEIGGSIDINSMTEKGTTISLQCRL